MLPRELRVSRCKAPHKTARAMEARQDRNKVDRKGGDRRDSKQHRRKAVDGETGTYVPKPTAESQTLAGRASKLLGRFGAAQLVGKPDGKDHKRKRDRRERGIKGAGAGGEAAGEKKEMAGFKKPEQFVFEGRRASARDGKPKDLKFKGSKGKGKGKVHKKRG